MRAITWAYCAFRVLLYNSAPIADIKRLVEVIKASNYISENVKFYLGFSVIVCLGLYLRMDQFLSQVLLDDEWHAIHQLINKSPSEIFLTFGHADFSIPLTLFYWLELKLVGLSEFGMRWPLMLAGILSLLIFPVYIRKYFDDKTTLVFSFLLSVSPLLILYSRTARPYALTLLLSMISLGAIYRFVRDDTISVKSGIIFVISSVLCVWLHLITLPFIVAPFIILGFSAIKGKQWVKVKHLFSLGIITLSGILLFILPPLLSHPEALGAKLGLNTPNLETIYVASYTWFGVAEPLILGLFLLLFMLGVARLWHDFPQVVSIVCGLALAVISIQLTQPDWVQYPQTFARYLLPIVPLMLLSVAIGFSRFIDLLMHLGGGFAKLATILSIILGITLITVFFPLRETLVYPNSNGLHIVYQLDFRDVENEAERYQEKNFPLSPFWDLLSTLPAGSLKIATGPFYFESYNWDAPRWERISGQRIMPGFLNGFCSGLRWGEVPQNSGFKFQNSAFIGDIEDLQAKNFDLVVFQKPLSFLSALGPMQLGEDTDTCPGSIEQRLPMPVYEDNSLIAYPLTKEVRAKIDAKR